MSTRCTDIVWQELDVKGSEKLLLLAIADISNHEGDNIHPSNEYLVWLTGIPLRTVQYFKSRWREMGALLPVENENGGAGNFVRYELHLEKFPRKKEWEGKRARAASFRKRAEKIKDATTAPLGQQKDAVVTPLDTKEGCNGAQSKDAIVAQKGAVADTEGCNGAQRNKEEPLAEPKPLTVSGIEAARRLSQAERDSWDLRRWQEKMKESQPHVGTYLPDPDGYWRQRAKDAAFCAGLSPSRLVELLKQHFPNDPNVDLLYQQSELFAGKESA